MEKGGGVKRRVGKKKKKERWRMGLGLGFEVMLSENDSNDEALRR